MSGSLSINETISISRHELITKASRSGGAGGQHVNKTSSRIEIFWSPAESAAFDDEARARVVQRLSHRLDSRGFIRIVADERRSQLQNRLLAEERLVAMVQQALHVPRVRRKTKRPKRATEARLEDKQRRGRKKLDRRAPIID